MRRGEIWSVNLDPSVGSEIRKKRPAIIINRDSAGILPLKIVVPLTSWRVGFEKAPWLVPLEKDIKNGVTKKSAADTFQVRSVSEERFVERLGELNSEDLNRVGTALALTLGL
jgi:mRNA interferase MazF